MHRIAKFMWASIYECTNAYNIWTVKSLSKPWVKQQNGRSFSAAIAGQAWALGRIGDEAAQRLLKCLIQRLQTNCNNRHVPVLTPAFQETKRNRASKTLGVGFQSSQKWICEHNSQIFLLLSEINMYVASPRWCVESWVLHCCIPVEYLSTAVGMHPAAVASTTWAFARLRLHLPRDFVERAQETLGRMEPQDASLTLWALAKLRCQLTNLEVKRGRWSSRDASTCTLGLCYNATKTFCNVHGDLVQCFSGEDAFSYSTGWKCCESCFFWSEISCVMQRWQR